jgi:hypothetical protein
MDLVVGIGMIITGVLLLMNSLGIIRVLPLEKHWGRPLLKWGWPLLNIIFGLYLVIAAI